MQLLIQLINHTVLIFDDISKNTKILQAGLGTDTDNNVIFHSMSNGPLQARKIGWAL